MFYLLIACDVGRLVNNFPGNHECSKTPLIRTLFGQNILLVLSGWSYYQESALNYSADIFNNQGPRKLFLVGGGAEIEVWRPSRAPQVRDFIGEIF